MLIEEQMQTKQPLVALDGPSALAFYRDRCDAATTLPESTAMPHYLGTPDPKDNEFWLSDEDVAALEAADNVFGASAFDDERTKNGPQPLARSRSRDLSRCTANSRDLKRLTFQELGVRPPTPTSPLHVLVGKEAARRIVANVRVRCLSTKLPANGMRRMGNTLLIPTPELTFLLLAQHLTLTQLIVVGMELCGHYRLVGAETGTFLHSRRTLYGQRPLTTPTQLREYLATATGFPGRSAALRAVKYIAPHSASPMETVVYLLLCLPRNLGGYALPCPILNAKRKVNSTAETFTLSQNLIPDLYWPSAGLDVEYDSEEFHSNPESLVAGARRTLALRAMNVDVVALTREIVYSVETFDTTARMLGKALKKRVLSENRAFCARRDELRAVLLP